MFKELRELGKETAVYGLSTVVARLLNFLLLPFYTHYLAPGEYGVVAVAFSYIAFLNILFQYGMDQAYMRYAGDKDAGGPELCFSTALWSLFATTGTLFTLLFLCAGPLARWSGLGEGGTPASGGGAALARYAAAILALDALTVVPFAELRLRHKKWAYVGIKFFNILVNVGMNVLLIGEFGYGVRGVFLASMFSAASSLVLLSPVFAQLMRARFDAGLLYGLLRFALPLVPAGLGAMMVQVIDRPILQRLTDAATVGVYQANYRLGIFMLLVVSMFDQAWRPFVIERAGRADSGKLFGRVLSYFLAATAWLALGLSLFIADLVRLPLGKTPLIHPDYWGGVDVVPVVLAAYVFHGAYMNFMASIILSKRTDLLIWVTLLGAAVNVAGNFLLIPSLGMLGAAWATFAAYACMAAALFLLGRKVHPIPYEYGRLLRLAGAVAAAIAGACWSRGTLAPDAVWGWTAARLGVLALLPALLFVTGFFTNEDSP